VEEEAYANLLIELFNLGRLSIPAGTTLRSYLSDKLKCDPMRITKKYAGESSIGKQSYHPDENFFCNSMEVQKLNEQFIAVENAFLKKINDRSAVFSRETLRADSPNSDYDGERQSLRNQRNREKPAVFSDFYSEENLDSSMCFKNLKVVGLTKILHHFLKKIFLW